MKKIAFAIGLIFTTTLISCATTTKSGVAGIERKQLLLLPESQVESMSLQSYAQTLKEADKNKTLNLDTAEVTRIRNISNRLIEQTPVFRADAKNWKWEVNVQKNDQVNAYCMPGGKIMVFTGLINQLKATDDELAVVIGHEISHALREHGRERMSLAYAQQGTVALIGILLGASSKNKNSAALATQGAAMGSQLFFALPNSRTQETEADRMGLELTARAGYNPEAAISLWTKMSKLGGSKPAEFFSSHPSNESRIQDLQNLMPRMMPLYEEAKSAQ